MPNEAVYIGTVWYQGKRQICRLWAENKEHFRRRVIHRVNNELINEGKPTLIDEDFEFGPISRKV